MTAPMVDDRPLADVLADIDQQHTARIAEIDAATQARIDRNMASLSAAIRAAGPDAPTYVHARNLLGQVEQRLAMLAMRWPSDDVDEIRHLVARAGDLYDADALQREQAK